MEPDELPDNQLPYEADEAESNPMRPNCSEQNVVADMRCKRHQVQHQDLVEPQLRLVSELGCTHRALSRHGTCEHDNQQGT